MNILSKIIALIYWLQIFLCPTLIFALIGFLAYLKFRAGAGLTLLIIPILIGAAIGTYFAEKIRKREGCEAFMARILGR